MLIAVFIAIINIKKINTKTKRGAEETAQWLKLFAALLDLGSTPPTMAPALRDRFL